MALAAVLTPVAVASPIGDAEDAIMAAWEKAGGDSSPLGARTGDVYPVGDGFACDFAGGKFFYTTASGARFMYGPVLAKYEQLGGPVGSDLGFPTINEVPGLAGPDSRVSTFSASDTPVIFWTPDHGAFVVRGALNAAWDKLGSSGGVLGAPVGDETYDGDVTSQKFSGGELSWNRKTKEFTTIPAVLGEQLQGLQFVMDPPAAINMAWRAAGGATGPLGAKKGGQYPIGGDGIAQDFVGGKIFFSPATGANAVESDILAKYESLGGPVSSDLGFPVANESDGGVGQSRIVTFSAADKPVIFWTSDHGAVVVRGAMKAAWDKLKGPTGKLGAPVGDQTVDGDVVSQKFTGGKISWNRATNTFTTDPANLAPLLSGLQVSGQNQPSTSASPPHAKAFTWHWWYLMGVIPVLLLIVMFALVAIGWRRRRTAPDTTAYEHDYEEDAAYESAAADGHWPHEDADLGLEHYYPGDQHPPDDYGLHAGSVSRVSWPRGAAAGAGQTEHVPTGRAYGGDVAPRSDEGFAFEEQDADAVDTTPTPVVTDADLRSAGFPDAAVAETVIPEPVVPEVVAADEVFPDDVGPDIAGAKARASEMGFPETAVPEPEVRTGRHAAAEPGADAFEAVAAAAAEMPSAPPAGVAPAPAARPTIHLPLDDPYQAPEGYPIKASARFGLYYSPSSALYHDTLAEIWFASEEVAQANGFIKAD
ncbi:hypothetical protein MLAC_26540 [Mycobacterium lacus]|uniref:Transmembrane alanine and glycine rich protein n=2 Tax=Mycobacterium lacus TaxID=169765 RepID=A0A7I7NLF9_9MYCO|nr:hypothetical protein MLAC_26540 [Mycobacterium lacus]